jgi:uncharacterized protein (UPF0264 family)
MMEGVVKAVGLVNPDILCVAAGYADYHRFGGLHYSDVVRAARDSGADAVMVDTAVKDGRTLFDALTLDELKEFVDLARNAGLIVALAGSIKLQHLELLAEIGPDIVGIRGAVCATDDRTKGITKEKVQEFVSFARTIHNSQMKFASG